MIFKEIVKQKIYICWICAHPQAIQDVDEFVSSSDLEKFSIPSLAHQWILCSEWVPSEWESKQLISDILDYRKRYYGFWTCILAKNALKMDLFFTKKNRRWTGVVWITHGLLCFYQLFGLLFWRHPFAAEHPLVSKWCNESKTWLEKYISAHYVESYMSEKAVWSRLTCSFIMFTVYNSHGDTFQCVSKQLVLLGVN